MQPVNWLYIRGVKKLLGKPGNVALAIAAALFVLTALTALWPIDNQFGTGCGSWIERNDTQAAYEDAKSTSKVDSILGEYGSSYRGVVGEKYTKGVDSCHAERDKKDFPLTVLAVATGAMLVVGIIRRYQPGGRAPEDAATS